MDVEVAHFVDAGDRDSQGLYDYYYEGDIYTFSNGEGHRLVVRTYSDEPAVAFFGISRAQARDSALAGFAVRHLSFAGVTTFRTLGASGAYEDWLPEPPHEPDDG